MADTPARIALLVDADNSPAAKIDVILAELAKYGVANIRRAYGNWKKGELKGWEAVLHDYAIRPMQQFDYTKGKSATDAAMIIDAMDLLYTHKIDAFAILSSDSDFTPLVMRIRAEGLEVYGFGAQKTPAPFVNACSKFLYLDRLGEPEATAETKKADSGRKSPASLKQDSKLVALLRNAVETAADDDGWAHLGAVGTQIGNQASFDPRNYGYRKLSDLIEASGLFETERRGNAIVIRDRRQKKPARAAESGSD